MPKNLCGYSSPADCGIAHVQAVVLGYGNNLIEYYLFSLAGRQFFDVEGISFLDSVLLAPSFNYCIHSGAPPPTNLAAKGTDPTLQNQGKNLV